MIKKMLLVMVLVSTSFLFAQQNISVPLDDTVYDILDYIQIRNYVKRLHSSKPYTLNLIIDTLNESLNHPNMSLNEREIVNGTIERLAPKNPTEFEENADVWQSIVTMAPVGAYRYEVIENDIPINLEIGVTTDLDLASNLNDPSISGDMWVYPYVQGDFGNNFSYRIKAGGGLMKHDLSAYKPYTFYQDWLGYQYLIADPDNFSYQGGKVEELAGGLQLQPEFGLAFFNNRVGINFSRIQHDWGIGNGSLVLAENAQPFTAIETYIRPVDFISLSYITGVLEFYRDSTLTDSSEDFQNAYTAFMGELFIKDVVYMGVQSTAIWPKRFELGYLLPGMIPFVNQNTLGDYENVQIGLSLGANLPEYATFYYNLFIDEVNVTVDDFFHKDRNMYAYQTGLNVALPNTPFVTFNFQYTKIEPYMYTHPGRTNPWYGDSGDVLEETMRMNYVNHGDPLGYYLQPNSDELKIIATAIPYWFLKIEGGYSLVRHGVDYGSGKVDGSNIDEPHIYNKNHPDYTVDINTKTKYFLTDGTYEWIHSLGATGEIDMRFINDMPLKFIVGYTFSFVHHTEPDTLNESFKSVNNSEYKNSFDNYVTFSVKLW